MPSKVAVWVSERVDEFDLDACKANTDHHIQATTVTATFLTKRYYGTTVFRQKCKMTDCTEFEQ